MVDITIPNNWAARPHQAPFMEYMFSGGKRAVCVWHRRAGKDSASLNFTAVEAHRKVATYWHCLPTAVQARKVVWDAINPYTGQRVLDQVWPKELRRSMNNTEMKIELQNGSIWQCVGSDTYDSLVGSNPYGVIFSEYSVSDPRAWDFVRPILAENGGWAIFIYTPRGKNHGNELFKMAESNPDWFCEILDIEHTKRNDGTPVITPEMFQSELNAGMDPQLAQQEFYCSFDTGMMGSYYSDQMDRAYKEKRIGDFPWIENQTVTTVWDLGIGDDNFIIFAQQDGEYCRIIDCIKGSGRSLGDWIKIVTEQPYIYDQHFAPHDIEQRDYSTGKTRIEFAGNLNFHFDIVPKVSLMDGIQAAREFFGTLRINSKKCQDLIDCLYSYRREWDGKLKVFKERPLHDWSSHGADDFRYLALSWNDHKGPMSHLVNKFRRGRMPKVIRAVGGRGR